MSTDTLFLYSRLREDYLNSDMQQGKIIINNFLRIDYLEALRKELVKDYKILSTTPNTKLQISLSPISRQCLWELHSGIMIRAIEKITNINNLLPDTHCKNSRLLLALSNPNIAQWEIPATQQEIAVVLIIFLDRGDAAIFTNKKSLAEIVITSNALQIIYWKKAPEITEEIHDNRN